MSSDEALRRENEALLAQIAALKARLGMAEGSAEGERARLRAVFDSFDAAGSGSVPSDEFDLLCFQAGAEAAALTPEGVAEALGGAADPEATGAVTFERYFGWLMASKYGAETRAAAAAAAAAAAGGEEAAAKAAELRALRMRLVARAWYRAFLHLQMAPPSETPPAAAADASGDEAKVFDFDVRVGGFDEARASLVAHFREDEALTAERREEVECPDEAVAFAYVDLAVREDADDMELGELAGMVEVVLDALPWAEIFPAMHSHTVDVHECDETGELSLRVVLFTTADPGAFVTQMAGMLAGGGDLDESWGESRLEVELPYSLADFEEDRAAGMALDRVGARVRFTSTLNRKVVSRARALASRLPPGRAYDLQRQAAAAEFFRSTSLSLSFGSVSEVMDRLPPHTSSHPLAEALRDAARQPVGEVLASALSGVAALASSQAELYSTARGVLRGVRRVHVQAKAHLLEVTLRGLEIVPFLPEASSS